MRAGTLAIRRHRRLPVNAVRDPVSSLSRLTVGGESVEYTFAVGVVPSNPKLTIFPVRDAINCDPRIADGEVLRKVFGCFMSSRGSKGQRLQQIPCTLATLSGLEPELPP